MGSRAQYVIVESGDWSLHQSRWGAGAIADDLVYGPEAATRSFRACDRVDHTLRHSADSWLDDVWCEGAALIDHDAHLLLWFDLGGEWADRAAHRAILARTWPGWEIRWAGDGLGDLLVHLGLDRDLLREPEDIWTPDGTWLAPKENDFNVILTVRREDGTLDVCGSGFLGAYDQLQSGEGLLDALPRGMPAPVMAGMPSAGIHFDTVARTLGVWSAKLVVGLRDWPMPGWENWKLEFWGLDHRPHGALVEGHYRFPVLDLRPSLEAWSRRIGTPAAFPAAALALAAQPPAGSGLTAYVHPEATVPHLPPGPTAEECQALRDVITELIADPPN